MQHRPHEGDPAAGVGAVSEVVDVSTRAQSDDGARSAARSSYESLVRPHPSMARSMYRGPNQVKPDR